VIQIEENKTKPNETSNKFDFSHPNTYAALNKLRLTDLNNNPKSPTFYRYSKEDIIKYLKDPAKFEKQLRDAVIYMYGASSQFRRIIQYFVGLSDLSYILTPYKVDMSSINQKTFKSQYFKSQNFIAQMDIKNQCPTMLTVTLREDVFYCTTWITTDNITFQQLPSEVCKISTIEGNVPNVSFNFSYFDTNNNLLNFYPNEFTVKYNIYSNDRTQKWQELDSPNSFAIKCNKDILSYALPPLAAILINLYELSDYQLLKMTKTELENYALLVMTLGVDKEGHWLMPFDDAKQYWKNLAGELPNLIGSVLTPMPIEKIDFNKTGTAEVDKVAESESHLFSAAGVSSQLFSNDKASSSSLCPARTTFSAAHPAHPWCSRYPGSGSAPAR
jgi:hypothetical protein